MSSFICELNPYFIETSELKPEIKILRKNYNFKNKENLIFKDVIISYLTTNYGRPEKENLNNWLEMEFEVE